MKLSYFKNTNNNDNVGVKGDRSKGVKETQSLELKAESFWLHIVGYCSFNSNFLGEHSCKYLDTNKNENLIAQNYSI